MAGSFVTRLFRNRLLIRAPIVVYRIGLGFLFGRRLVMVAHKGRRSGEVRYVVLEVVVRPSDTEVVLASALGREAQWFQNLKAEPHCHVSTGFRRRVPATAVILNPDDAAKQLEVYQAKHPELWKKLSSLMLALHAGDADFELPLVRLTLQDTRSRS